MKDRLNKLLRPSSGWYYLIMALFVLGSLAVKAYWLALGEAGIVVVAQVIHRAAADRRRRLLRQYVQSIPGAVENEARGTGPFPAVMVRLEDSVIVWENHQFSDLVGGMRTITEQKLDEVLPGVTTDFLSAGKNVFPQDVSLDGKRYRIYGVIGNSGHGETYRVGVLYLSDLTEMYQIRDEYIRSRPVVSIILVDNFEELSKNLTEAAISNLTADINEIITKWTEEYHGLLRRLDRNRFLFIFEKKDLEQAKSDRFSLLEDVHQVINPSGLPASISMGLGVDADTFEESYNFAALAIEMALSRGGDQAVIKDRFDFAFYGGRKQEADYSSRVRARVMANSLMELIGQSGYVFIMGHRNADMDAIGAAVGIACLCRKKGKPFHIVVDQEKNMAQKLIDEISKVPEYKNAFISGQEALLLSDTHSILVVVDTNRPDQVESRSLLESISKVCVVDHHRRAADYISPVVVNLHEPSASSAAELVTELVTYAADSKDVLPIEAKSLLAGICLDTKFFNVRTGERTFEAAATLRRLGADTTEVKLLLQSDFQDTMERYQIIKSARMYRGEVAIAAMNAPTSRVMAAQAADELLNISGISASFVLYPDGDQVIVSARSIGSANVQMILEPLGGGGNAATAGAQLRGTDVQSALDRLVESIDKFYET